jgi:hypothetical protein
MFMSSGALVGACSPLLFTASLASSPVGSRSKYCVAEGRKAQAPSVWDSRCASSSELTKTGKEPAVALVPSTRFSEPTLCVRKPAQIRKNGRNHSFCISPSGGALLDFCESPLGVDTISLGLGTGGMSLTCPSVCINTLPQFIQKQISSSSR